MNRQLLAFASVLALLLTGCTHVKPRDDYWIKAGQAHSSNNAISLLYYADYLRTLEAAEYSAEVERVRRHYDSDKTDFFLVQYVLTLSAAGADQRRSLALAESLLKDRKIADADLSALAQMIAANLAERRRLDNDARRAEIGAKRADELEKKLEALKTIEKSMIQRAPRNSGNQ